MDISKKTDDEILEIANPFWSHLIKASNDGKYGEFVRHFAYSLIKGLNEIEVGKQFANSELTRNLSESVEFLGTIRRDGYVTVLYRTRSKKRAGEWLGRLVLGFDENAGEVKIFGASIF
ncbi:MAG: hypothetical protein O2944_00405 [Proteobacteria bacterium]|nr:hypothetical protein [Pseudomonadota bacterium]